MYSSQQYRYPQQQQQQYSAYPQASYAQVPSYSYPQQPQYAPPPPPDPRQMPPSEFRTWFLGKLSELVVNQKTIIHNLAFIANDNATRMPHVVAECIETHIRQAHPQVKLPAWYLLDSIAKNIGAPYINLFAKSIARLFLDSYHVVDVSTRSKMEEMLVTWRTGGRGGTELFGVDAQTAIEKGVWSVPSTSSTSVLSRPTGPTKAQVLTELEVILAQKTRAVEINPYDDQAIAHVDSLMQLRTLVQTSAVSQQDLAAIATQLRNLARTTASAAPPLPPMVPPPQPVFAPQPPPLQGPYPSYTAPAAYPTAPTPVNVSSGSTRPAIPAVKDINSLWQSLVKSGAIAASSSTSSSSSTSAALASLSSLSHLLPPKSEPENVSSSAATAAADPQAETEKEYERAILSLSIPLTASGIQREQPQAISFLYDYLSLQCKQCGQRFPDGGAKDKKRYEDHLDLHARQNLRNATAANSTSGVGTMGRGYTRSWFVGKQDWVNDITREGTTDEAQSSGSADKGKARADSPSGNAKASTEERDAKLRTSYVVIPPGDEAKNMKCPICKEVLRSEFLEDEEEWVWRNAVSVKGKVYHATCHADAITAKRARLLHDGVSSGRSRSATPDAVKMEESESRVPRSTLHPSPLAGLKRKAEDSDSDYQSRSRSASASDLPRDFNAAGVSVKFEETDSPRPFKKLALSSA